MDVGGDCMRRHILCFGILFLGLLLSACSKKPEGIVPDTSQTDQGKEPVSEEPVKEEPDAQEPDEELPIQAVESVEAYMPYPTNTRYVYQGEGNEYASYDVYVDYRTDNRVQTRTNNGGTEMVRVIEYQDGKIVELLAKGETYYRENFTNTKSQQGNIVLQGPIQTGTSWTDANKQIHTITNTAAKVTTPLGSYTTIEVTTQGENDQMTEYYAAGVGLIRSVFQAGDTQITSTLTAMETNAAFKQTIAFYYPDKEGNFIYRVEKPMEFHTNDITRTALITAYKEVNAKDCNQVLGPDVVLKSLYLNQDGMVYADFNRELVTEMNAGSGYEGMLLQCITNTLGGYYGVDRVYITMDGKPYESGHFLMRKGEAFRVDNSNVKEYQ